MKQSLSAVLFGVLAVLALILLWNFRAQDDIHDLPPLTPPTGESVAGAAERIGGGALQQDGTAVPESRKQQR